MELNRSSSFRPESYSITDWSLIQMIPGVELSKIILLSFTLHVENPNQLLSRVDDWEINAFKSNSSMEEIFIIK